MESSKVPSRLLPILFGHALLQSTPGAQLPELPDELLVEILTQLDVSSLKKARLTCRRWGVAGARGLFRRVYFAPRKDLMSVFQAITGNPAFAVNITELVYDARMFWSKFLEPSAYSEAYTRINPVPQLLHSISITKR